MGKRLIVLSLMVCVVLCGGIALAGFDPWNQESIQNDLKSGQFLDANKVDRLGDNRAKTYNDLFTIIIEQSSDAKMEENVKTDKKSTFDASVGAFPRLKFGGLSNIKSVQSGTGTGALPEASLESGSKFDGKGERTKKTTYKDNIQAKIVEVLPNNTVRFEASKQLTVGDDSEVVIFSGVIRLLDISDDNSISSSKVADACVVYVGKGTLAKTGKRGALGRVLDYFWLF